MSFHDEFLWMSSKIGNVTTHIHLIIEHHQNIINKIKNLRSIGIGAFVNELKKVNDDISIVDGKKH